MALLELDFTEFKELTQARLSDRQDTTVQQLHEELQQLKKDNLCSVGQSEGGC